MQGLLYARELAVRSGTSSVLLNGSLYAGSGMEFLLEIDSLSAFSNDLAGSLEGQGMLSLDPESPRFAATLSGTQLSFGPLEIEQLELKKDAQKQNTSELLLLGLNAGERFIESVTVKFNGVEPLQNIRAHAQIEGSDIDLDLRGSVVDWADPLESGWNGTLHELRLNHQQFTIALDEPAKVNVSPARLTLEKACFNGSRNGNWRRRNNKQ